MLILLSPDEDIKIKELNAYLQEIVKLEEQLKKQIRDILIKHGLV